MERCSISPVARLLALRWLLSLLLLSLLLPPSTCNRDDREAEEQLSVTAQATPTPLWAVVWGPTQPLEDETYHFISSQETEPLSHPGRHLVGGSTTAQDWPRGSPGSALPPGDTLLLPKPKEDDEGTEAEETEPEEVDPQFYVTVTISSLLILTAVVITAKLCYDRSCSHHPPPLSRGVAPPLSLALPRSLASEESRQTLHSTSSSFADRER
ncbi:PILR alpha-associated neural protein [Boleophthalmus pectinirostris]|uniref:PILR alpha-associated neural protein n=1 Tax=Boleophthalmus pectinirostris TaxID=150288 RepID=UPI000A1C5B90|nr:PILR alpha-associated neural protein [Boleophthalmus pectinirostris]